MIARPSLREADLLLDHRVRADDEAGLARRDLRQHLVALLALPAAGEPGDGDAERREPADQLLQVLLGEDLGRRHQRALPAGVDRARRGERGDDRLAGADVALQQAVHRHGARRGRRRSRRRRAAARASARTAARRGSASCSAPRAAASAGARWRWRSRWASSCESCWASSSSNLRRCQAGCERSSSAAASRPGAARAGGRAPGARSAARRGTMPCGQVLVEVGAGAAGGDRLAQHRLRQLHRARVDRRQRGRQRRLRRHDLERRMDHLEAEEAAARLAAHAHALAGRERLLLRRIEVEEAHHQVAAVVGDLDDELAARPELDARIGDDAFDLAGRRRRAARRSARRASRPRSAAAGAARGRCRAPGRAWRAPGRAPMPARVAPPLGARLRFAPRGRGHGRILPFDDDAPWP